MVVVAIAPIIIFCRRCHEPKEDPPAATNVHATEDEVVYGEIRFPPETQNEHDTNNPGNCECAKKTTKHTTDSESTDHDKSTKVKQMPREVSCTPEIPPHYNSDDSCLTKKCDSKHNIIITVNPSYRLKRSFFAEADELVNITELVHSCEREASHIPATLPQTNSGNNSTVMNGYSKSMPPKPSQRNTISTEADKSKLLPTCKRGCTSTSSILPPRRNNNSGKIFMKCDSEESILMTKNPSYQYEKEFVAEQ